MKREEKGGREAERKEGIDGRCSKAGAKTEYTTTTSVAEEATGPALMEGVERMNAVVVRGQGAGQEMGVSPRWDPYAMEVDRGRNCFACGGFGHMARHCRNRGRGRPMEGRRVEYSGGRIEEILDNTNNLKGEGNLELLD